MMDINNPEVSNLVQCLDWILRIVGIWAIIKTLLSFFYNLFKTKYDYDEIKIIADPTDNDLNQFHYYESFKLKNSDISESTLFAPSNSSIHKISLYELSLTNKGKLKKTKKIYNKKVLYPNNAILFYIHRNCGAPSTMLSWKSKDGYTSEYYFSENGFNGNNSVQVTKYKKGFINYLIDFIFKK